MRELYEQGGSQEWVLGRVPVDSPGLCLTGWRLGLRIFLYCEDIDSAVASTT